MTLQEEEDITPSGGKLGLMKNRMKTVRDATTYAGGLYNQCDFVIEAAKAPLNVKWAPRDAIAEESHWRDSTDELVPRQPSDGTYCSWVMNPILKREWTRVREDKVREDKTWIFRNASPLCKEAIITAMRQDRPDVTRPIGGWLDGMDGTRQLAELAFNNGGALVQALAPGRGKLHLSRPSRSS